MPLQPASIRDYDHPLRWPLTPAIHCSTIRQTCLFFLHPKVETPCPQSQSSLRHCLLEALLAPSLHYERWVGDLHGLGKKRTDTVCRAHSLSLWVLFFELSLSITERLFPDPWAGVMGKVKV